MLILQQKQPYALTGQNAVVTGSSSGIGRAIALELARGGANVLVHARQSGAAADAVADEIRAAGRDAAVVLADLADTENQSRLIHQAWEWREIDIWVNNAGADVLTGAPAAWTFDQKLQSLWQVDVAATLQLSRMAGERMKRHGHGVILNMGWDQADTGMEGDSGQLFTTAKGAVMALTRSLAKSLAPEVRVNCLAPGWIRTGWSEEADEYWQQRARSECLLQRWGEPDDVAHVARFLASPAGAFVNGQVIHINGGLRATASTTVSARH